MSKEKTYIIKESELKRTLTKLVFMIQTFSIIIVSFILGNAFLQSGIESLFGTAALLIMVPLWILMHHAVAEYMKDDK